MRGVSGAASVEVLSRGENQRGDAILRYVRLSQASLDLRYTVFFFILRWKLRRRSSVPQGLSGGIAGKRSIVSSRLFRSRRLVHFAARGKRKVHPTSLVSPDLSGVHTFR